MSMVTWWPPSAKPSDVHEAAAGEHRDRGRAGAHVDHGGAEIGFVVGQHGKAGDIGARHHRLDDEMAALDREHQIARRGDVGRRHVHVDAERWPSMPRGSRMPLPPSSE